MSFSSRTVGSFGIKREKKEYQVKTIKTTGKKKLLGNIKGCPYCTQQPVPSGFHTSTLQWVSSERVICEAICTVGFKRFHMYLTFLWFYC